MMSIACLRQLVQKCVTPPIAYRVRASEDVIAVFVHGWALRAGTLARVHAI
jgi:hypothetical protein